MRPKAPWLLYGLLTTSLGLNLYMVLKRPLPSAALAQVASSSGQGVGLASSVSLLSSAEGIEGPVPVVVEVIQPEPVYTPIPSEWTITEIDLEHSLSRSFTRAVGDQGAALSAVYARMFHWELDLRRDLYKGDRMKVAWRITDGTPEIAAASLVSGKLGRTLQAYRWHRPGDGFESYWQKDGVELPWRLKESPLADYVQVTGLLRDRPDHKGMDFKTPVGTPILATRAGTVTRSNWNTGANGGCVELRFNEGTLAKYLHLSGVSVRPGQTVAVGQVIGLSGNTGRTTAPHLHYQLNRGQKALDPVKYHGTIRRSLSSGDMDAFLSDVARLDALLGNALARG